MNKTSHVAHAIHSHSSLNIFENCPKKYFHIKVAEDTKQTFGPKTPQQREGDDFHKAVETCLLVDNDQLPPKFDAEHYIQSYAHVLSLRYKVRDATYGNYVSRPELSLAVNDQFEPVSYFDSTIPKMFRGRIDYAAYAMDLEDSPNGRFDVAVMVDLKTGKSSYSTDQQLERMALLMFANFPHINKIIAGYIWVNEEARFDPVRFTREKNYAQLKAQLLYDINNMSRCETSGNWPAIPSGLCKNYCPVVNSVCEHSGKKG